MLETSLLMAITGCEKLSLTLLPEHMFRKEHYLNFLRTMGRRKIRFLIMRDIVTSTDKATLNILLLKLL